MVVEGGGPERRLRNRVEAEELAQDALARTWRRWAFLRRPDNPALYARRVLVNRQRTLLRRAVLEARYARRSAAEGPPADRSEDSVVLWAALRKLPARQRAVLVLRYHEDLTEAEVARVLGLPLGTVKSLAHRGIARLRGELEPVSDRARSERRTR